VPAAPEPDHAVGVLRVLEAARRSAETGQTVRVPTVGGTQRPPG